LLKQKDALEQRNRVLYSVIKYLHARIVLAKDANHADDVYHLK